MADTEPSDVVWQPARDADMMVCRYSDERSVMKSNNEHRGRCSTNGVGQLAQEAGVKHFVFAFGSDREGLPPIDSFFGARVEEVVAAIEQFAEGVIPRVS